ncbi:UvrD-helicase domain-containing protein [Allorhizocola rhizosphaerae]|uniref:UvrD-helicase domain-containing protein n=1 Tax=Allorhizocola rhizosphaerae TaxID=1872709 RepID=UPI000E3C3DDE|nr:UvrD-helicase domain-containing protein [Allorhizocola rhizosphaerae]
MTTRQRVRPIGKQRNVCASEAPTLLVLGGAGTGKTVTAAAAARAHLLRRDAIAATGAARDRVLFLTFSRTAVTQILSRSRGILRDVADRVEVMTFHGLAWQLLCDFGRYAGHRVRPALRSDAESKLFEDDPDILSYSDLLPEALKILRLPRIGALAKRRWSLVVCDEFQDTDSAQWELLELLTVVGNRLLLLGDPNQMIYDRLPGRSGVGPQRLTAALARPGAEQIDLPLGSHRDPTMLLPTVAEAVRQRNFNHPALAEAIGNGRLRIVTGIDEQPAVKAVCEAIDNSRQQGANTFGIFLHGNEPTAAMSAALTERGVDHDAVGLSESYGEALSTFLTMLEFAAGTADWEDVLVRMAVFYTSTVRSKRAPGLAFTIGRGQAQGLLATRLNNLRAALFDAPDLDAAAQIAAESWPALGLNRGIRQWRRAAADVTRLMTLSGHALDSITRQVALTRLQSFTDVDEGDRAAIQLMNLHQTKGRESDAIVAVFRADDYYGNETEPFTSASRLLYVVLTRARRHVTLLLPTNPHPLVTPFAALASHGPTSQYRG